MPSDKEVVRRLFIHRRLAEEVMIGRMDQLPARLEILSTQLEAEIVTLLERNGWRTWFQAVMDLALAIAVTVVYQFVAHQKLSYQDLIGVLFIMLFVRVSIIFWRKK